ncbi:hypothetical protein MMC12_001453 [Toensbergia leucococca]|nr:hypothetical protein [Toensbergia leucococca]
MAGPMRSLSMGSEPASDLSGTAKLDEITRLMKILDVDLQEINLLPPQRNALLQQLKTHIRTVEHADPLFTKEVKPSEASREPKARRNMADGVFSRNDNREDELLNSRILFLLTYESTLDFDDLIEHHLLAESMNLNITRHSKFYSKHGPKSPPPPPMDTLALSETLKLLFNLTQYYPHHVATFTKSLPNILKILSRAKIPSPPLQPPVTYLINSLLNLDLDSNKCKPSSPNPLFPKNDPQCNIDRLISILDSTVRLYTEEQSENLATPLVTLLRKIYELAPTPVKTHMQSLLLPSNDERTKPLGQSDTLAACLLRHFSSPLAPNLRESVSSMIFDLSDKNPTTFVRNVGYGFAAGYLATHNLAVPDDAMEKWNTRGSGDTEEDLGLKVTTSADGKDINPVTGQRRDMEPMDLGPDMTDEEKEREAEKLFVLFERLKATGVMNVQNPVEKAVQEGRFEELN